MFTDFVDDAYNKNLVGWSFVLCSLANLIWPNGYLAVKSLIPSLIIFCTKKNDEDIEKEEKMNNYY